MRRILLLILLIVSASLSAQQLPQYTQYMLNHFGLNPAAVSSKNCWEVKLGYRQQWTGFVGAPITQYVSAVGFLKSKKKGYKKGKHAVGAYVENDATPPLSYTGAYLSYSYHKPIGRELWAAVGIHAGVMQSKIDLTGTNYKIEVAQSGDNALKGTQSKIIYPDLNPGIWLYNKHMYAGLSIKNAWGNKLVDVYGVKNRLTRHYYLTYGHRILSFSGTYSFIPSINLKYSAFGSFAADLNFMFDYSNRFALGLSYRNTDAICALVRIGIGKSISIGYSFDYTTSKIRFASSNTHEFVLGLKLCAGKGEREDDHYCPAYQ